MLELQFLFLLLMLYIGSRFGGMALGTISGLGLVIEVFVFRQTPASPPITVVLIIVAVISCVSTLEACGTLKYMLQIAERILRKNPKRIIFLGPITTWLLTAILGTGHAVYSIMPIISEIALKNKIRPERACASSSVACQLGITASPLSAAVVYALSQFTPVKDSITLLSILMITVPATFCGVLCMSFYSVFRGKELEQDPEYQKRLQNPEMKEAILHSQSTTLGEKLPKEAKVGFWLFFSAIICIIFIAFLRDFRTIGEATKPVPMSTVIQMIMLAFAGVIMLITKTPVQKIASGVVFKAGLSAAIAIYGIGWMSNTYFNYAMPSLKPLIINMVHTYPWLFAVAMFLVSVLINSQGATLIMMLPVALNLGLSPILLIGILPSCYGYFFIPNYPTDIATTNFDLSGTTKIGKYYFNHSFMMPGLISVTTACLIGYVLSSILL